MPNLSLTPRDVARELARRYSTMTHEELDILESVLVPMKFAKNEKILGEGETCEYIYSRVWCDSITSRTVRN